MKSIAEKVKSLPSSPGVYIFKNKEGEVLYVGKAASLHDRVGSYFQNRNGYERPIEYFIDEVKDLETKRTETVLEAFILEQDLIKRIQPKYNVLGKDDKSFAYILVTKEEFPRFEVKRKTDIVAEFCQGDPNCEVDSIELPVSDVIDKKRYSHIYGPYTSRRIIERALKMLRRIFPYHGRSEKTERGCLDYQIGLCPGPYDENISREEYQKNIRGIRMILEGRKKGLVEKMRKEMEGYSAKENFERAAKVRNQMFALQHIQDVALLASGEEKMKFPSSGFQKFRVEAYDISNLSGSHAVGSMVVFDNSDGDLSPNKSQYRKFRIKTVEGINDVGAMEEVLRRRFRNNWHLPDLIVLDGGRGHLNMARRVLRVFHLFIPLLAVAKGPTRKKLDLYSYGTVPELSERKLTQIRDEAHRFAITYHKNLRSKNALN